MNTQNLLHERSADIPEGLYIDLMNKLKIDFETKEEKSEKQTLIVVRPSLPSRIQLTKEAMIKNIIIASINWENREEILLKITKKRLFIDDLKKICDEKGLPTMGVNPRWVEQQRILSENPRIANALSIFQSNSPHQPIIEWTAL